MTSAELTTCPCCGNALAAGFASKAAGLSYVAPEKFHNFAFVDEDLAEAGLTKFFPSKAAYFRSYLCRACELYVIDYSTVLNRQEAAQLAASLVVTT